MKRQILIGFAALLCSLLPKAAGASERPAIAGPVLNGASFQGYVPTESGPMPIGTGLAGGSIFVLFGSGLGPSELVVGAAPYPDQLPADAGGTRVTFRSLDKGEVYSAPLIHSWQNQVAGIVPSPLPVGLAEVTVSYDGQESEPTKVEIVEFSPGLFTVSQNGQGPAAAQNYESSATQPLNTLTHPASPGQYLILWGTGLGPIDGPDNIAPTAGNLRSDVSVRIGGVEVLAEYAGRSPEFPGVDQINVRIPDDGSIEMGCYQELGFQIGNHGFGAPTSVSISDTPGECDHPWGLSAEKLAELDAGGDVTFIEATLTPEFSVVTAARLDAYGVSQNQSRGVFGAVILPAPVLSGSFSHFLSGTLTPFFSGTFSPFFPGVCLPATVFQAPPVSEPPGPRRLPPGQVGLLIGDSVEFSGPGARAFSLPKSVYDPTAFGPVAGPGEDVLAPGEWMMSAAGGADMAAFHAPFSVVDLPNLNLPTSVQLGGAMEITWDGSGYEAGDHIVISLQQNPEEPPQAGSKALRCHVAATRGSVEITEQNLASLEAEPGSPLLWNVSLEAAPQAIETEGLDYGRLTASISLEVEATAAE